MLKRVKEILGLDKKNTVVNLPPQLNKIELTEWLNAVGKEDINIDWSAEYLTLYGIDSILERQRGYTDLTGKLKGNWQKNWIAIGDIHGDPIICDFSFSPCQVMYSRHGQGSWETRHLASSINIFSKSLTIWSETYFVKFNKKILDDDFEVLHSFTTTLSDALSTILNDEERDTFIFAAVA